MRIAELEGQTLKSKGVVQTQSTIHEDDQSFAKITLEDREQDTNTDELPAVLVLKWDPEISTTCRNGFLVTTYKAKCPEDYCMHI